MKRTITLFACLLLTVAAGTVMAQSRLALDLKGDAAFATQKLGDAELGTGVGFEGVVSYRFMPHLSGYGGWGWQYFPTSGAGLGGTDLDVEETGYSFGLEFAHPLGSAPLDYFVRAGGIINHIELEDLEGDITADTKHGLGWQAGMGLRLPVSNSWRVSAEARYRALSRELDLGDARMNVDLSYVSLGFGASWTF